MRKRFLLILPVLVYLITLLLALSELDRQYYQREKESIIKYNFRALFRLETIELQQLSQELLLKHDAQEPLAPAQVEAWRDIATTMLDSEGCVFRIRIVPKDGEQILEQRDDEKFKRLNHFANTLFYRNFQNVVSYEIGTSTDAPWLGLLSFHYTTPENYEPIVALTHRYRLWSLLVFVAITGGFFIIMRRMVLPTRRVVDRIDVPSSAGAASGIMPAPKSILERSYNNLARDAALLRLGQSFRNLTSENPNIDRSELLATIPDLLQPLLDYRAVLLYDLHVDETGHASISGCVVTTRREGKSNFKEYCAQHVFPSDAVTALIDAGQLECPECVAHVISPSDESEHRTVLVLFPPRTALDAEAVTREWHLQTACLVAEHVRDRLEAFELQRRYLLREKSRANINLARNLGHDLTNIIATSRLDMMTLKKMLERSQAAAGATDDANHAALSSTLTGLLNNTRLLQEVVNIYRSFGYLSSPRLESVQINALLDELIDVFSLSMPAKSTVRRDYHDGLPDCTVEPRLLKLAVFNLLTNAVTAIKQNVAPDRADGVITVSTAPGPDGNGIAVSIRDNGTGILNQDGQIASQPEIDQIFKYGVTTKSDTDGEGLGLSWVSTIVEEFHHGTIAARNHPDGGGELTLCFSDQ